MFDNMKVININPGNVVLCDLCNEDFTTSTKSGGMLIGSKAICPNCTPRIEYSVKEYNEESSVKARCPENKSFADWVRDDLR